MDELKNKIVAYENENDDPSLAGLLEEIALVADVDGITQTDDMVLLMTLHSAKGLEFPCVFICGMEDRLFPSGMALNSEDPDAVNEERRLCYVGITRAMEELYLSAAKQRMMHGTTNYNAISRFVKEIPQDVLMINGEGSFALKRQKQSDAEGEKAQGSISSFAKRTPYAMADGNKVSQKPSFGKEFKVEPAKIDYEVGDRVRHVKFGEGQVLELLKGDKDYEVKVDFENLWNKADVCLLCET